jgi:ribosomal protein S18 acetylase RimI-like enzyme
MCEGTPNMPMTNTSRPRVSIRLATPADAYSAIPMVNEAFAAVTFLDGTRTDEPRMAKLVEKGEFLIAADNDSGRVVAFVYTEKRGDRGYFGMLAVDPSTQGIGLGRRMVEAAEEHCRKSGCKHIDITVLSRRSELVPYYRNLGYEETGTEEFRPSRPINDGIACHCIVMSKTL